MGAVVRDQDDRIARLSYTARASSISCVWMSGSAPDRTIIFGGAPGMPAVAGGAAAQPAPVEHGVGTSPSAQSFTSDVAAERPEADEEQQQQPMTFP